MILNSKREKPLNAGKLLEKAGYTKTVAEATPGRIMEQAGVKEALNDFGFNVDNAKMVVAKIMMSDHSDDNPRLKAAEMVFKVHGAFPKEGGGVAVQVNVINDREEFK